MLKQRFEGALTLHRQGHLADARNQYLTLLAYVPAQAAALGLVGITILEEGKPRLAMVWFRRSLALVPDHLETLRHYAQALLQSSLLSEAEAVLHQGLALSPGEPAIGLLHAQWAFRCGQLNVAKRWSLRVISLQPNASQGFFQLGKLFEKQNDFESAISAYDEAVRLQPRDSHEQSSLGEALFRMAGYASALRAFDRVVLLNPGSAKANSWRAMALQELNQSDSADDALRRAQQLKPWAEGLRFIQGEAFERLGRLSMAIQSYRQAIILAPDRHRLYGSLGAVCLRQGQNQKALCYGVWATLIRPDSADNLIRAGHAAMVLGELDLALFYLDRALQHQGQQVEVFVNRGTILYLNGKIQSALSSYASAAALKPDDLDAYQGMGAVSLKQHAFRNAMVAFHRAFMVSGQRSSHLSGLLYCSLKTWDWEISREVIAMMWARRNDSSSVGNPYPLLMILDDPVMHRLGAELHAREQGYGHASWISEGRDLGRGIGSRGRYRIGLFSSDLRWVHPVCANLLPFFHHMDRERFEWIAFDLAPDGGDPEILRLFDAVYPIFGLEDRAISELARGLDLDLALDLNGYTEGAKTGIFSQGVAPVQVNFLGYPGTMGTGCHDWIIADEYVIPEGAEKHYSERVARLPHFFMPYDVKSGFLDSGSRPLRSDYGLPEDAFVYASFNDFHKITEVVFERWIRILQRTQGTVLWIAFRGDLSRSSFLKRFEAKGVDPGRVIVAERVDPFGDHLARLTLSDLMLDTFPYNSHTTACDALSVGLPLLTVSGQSFASRVSGSLLRALGVDELIAPNLEAYEAKAIELSEDQKAYEGLRSRVERGRSGLMDPKDYARNFEKVLKQMVCGDP